MKLFGNRKNEKGCCGGNDIAERIQRAEENKQEKGIKILGSGCKKCMELEKNVRFALEELQLEAKVEHVTDFAEIASYGVMTTPALVMDKEVVAYGKVLSPAEAKALLSQKWSAKIQK